MQDAGGDSVWAPALSAGRHPCLHPLPAPLDLPRSAHSVSAFTQLQINPMLPLLFSVSFWFRRYDSRFYFHYTAPSGSCIVNLLKSAGFIFFPLQPDMLNSARQLSSVTVQKREKMLSLQINSCIKASYSFF